MSKSPSALQIKLLQKLETRNIKDARIANLAKKYASLKQKSLKFLKYDQQQPLTTFQNDIIVDQKSKTIFLPAYMRIKLKNITSINLEELSAQVNCDIIFNIYYGKLSQEIVDVLKNKVTFLFQKNQPIKVVEQEDGQRNLQIKVSPNEKQSIKFTLRKILKTKIGSQIFWTPFNVLNMILSITVQPINYNLSKERIESVKNIGDNQKQKDKCISKWNIKINLMDHLENYFKFSFNQNIHYGGFNFAPVLGKCFYSNKKVSSALDFQFKDAQQYQKNKISKFNDYVERIKKSNQKLFKSQEQEDEIQTFTSRLKDNFQYAHFNIAMYKVPYQSIVTIFLPLMLLGIINLCIFFQRQTLSNRIGSIASLMIAFVALVPIVRQKIAPSPSITIVQIMVYMETLSSLLAFFHSMKVRTISNYQIQYSTDGLFIVSLIFNLLIASVIIVMLILYHFKWMPFFKSYPWTKKVSFKRQEWFNSLCYENFKDLIENQQKHYTYYKQLVDLKNLSKDQKKIQ